MESRIHSQPMLPRDTGATQGRRMSSRTIHLPRKSFCSDTARMVARKMTITWEATAKRKVFRSARRKLGSSRADRKFSRPTKRPAAELTVTSLTENQRERMNGIPITAPM